jgi:hypothetical protein
VRNPGPRADLQAFTLDSRVARPDGGSENGDGSDDNGPLSGSTLGDHEDAHPALPDTAVPIGLLANLAISNAAAVGAPAAGGGGGGGSARTKRGRRDAGDAGKDEDGTEAPIGVANDKYFVPGPSFDLKERMRMIDKTAPPDILVHGIVTPDDVEKLFQMCVVRPLCPGGADAHTASTRA